MTAVAIPQWDVHGVLPPIDQASPTSAERSPYVVSLNDLVLRFGTSTDRQRILRGLFDFRMGLHAVGMTQGFQWLDGSFLENVEMLEKRPPRDIDVVTFYRLPPGLNQVALASKGVLPATTADHAAFKHRFSIDSYSVSLEGVSEHLVERSAYWYSVFSHRRNRGWKGYVQINLAPLEDATALALLASLAIPGDQT